MQDTAYKALLLQLKSAERKVQQAKADLETGEAAAREIEAAVEAERVQLEALEKELTARVNELQLPQRRND